MDKPERGNTDHPDNRRRVTESSLSDSAFVSLRELDVLFDQSPLALIFSDRELRAKRTNAALRQLTGIPDAAVIGRRPSEVDHGVDAAWNERILAEQVIGRGIPLV